MKCYKIFVCALLVGTSLSVMAGTPYTIYPIPQQQVETAGTIQLLPGKTQVILGASIDEATKARIRTILVEHGIMAETDDAAVFKDAAEAGYSHIYIGVNGSGDPADLQATALSLDRTNFSLENKYDKHVISISADDANDGKIVVLGENTDAAFIGLASIEQILDAGQSIPCGTVYDYADQKNRGLVEGYYGVPYSIDVKKDLMRFMMRYKMNSYMYGAKNDPYHKEPYWKVPYPTTITEEQRQGGYLTQNMVKEITDVSHATKVNFIWAIHPGNDFLNSSSVVSDIMGKFTMMYNLGVRQFAVFVDDVSIPSTQTAYELNATRVTDLQHAIENKWNVDGAAPVDTVKPLQFVPHIYCVAFAGGENDRFRDYFRALSNTPDNVAVYTTGWGVWSVPNSGDVNTTRKYLGRDVAWWWNYPCNDNDDTKVFPMDMYNNFKDETNISSSATVDASLNNCLGVLSNPMQQGEISKIALFGVADYAWNNSSFDNTTNWEAALPAVVGSEKAEDLKTICRYIRYYDTDQLSALITTYKSSLRRGNPDGTALRAEMQKIVAAATSLQQLKDSKDVSDRLLYTDMAPWLNKIQSMAEQTLALLSSAEKDDLNDKWNDYAPTVAKAAAWDTEAEYQVPQLENTTVHAEPSNSQLKPFITYMHENALGDDLSEKASSNYAVYSNLPSPKGRITNTNNTVSFSGSTNTLEKGQYIGVSLPQPTVLSDITIADTIFEHYSVMYSMDAKSWTRFTQDNKQDVLSQYIKYICILNETDTPRSLRLVNARFRLTMPSLQRPASATMPEDNAWQGHTAQLFMDGDYTTFATLNRNQKQGDAYTVTLSQTVPINDVRVCVGTTNGDYMTMGHVQISADGKTWKNIVVKGTSMVNFTMNLGQVVKYSNEMSYCDFDGKGQEAKYVRLYVQTPNTSKWLRLFEIEVNRQSYENSFKPVCVDNKGVALSELSDGMGYTGIAASTQSVIYYLYNNSKQITIWQDASLADGATVSVAENGDDTRWTQIGTLTDNIQVVDLTPYPSCTAVKLQWATGTTPAVYEITEDLETTDMPVISGITPIGESMREPMLSLEAQDRNIRISSSVGVKAVHVHATDGRMLLFRFSGGQHDVTVSTTNLAKGNYIITVQQTDGTSQAYKVLVK